MTKLVSTYLGAALLMASVPIASGAQDASTLPPGTRLRVNGRCAVCVARTGDFARMESDTLWLRSGSHEQPFPRSEIITLEMRVGRDRLAAAGKGAGYGFLIAGGSCAILATGSANNSSGEGFSPQLAMVVGLVACGSVGAIVGFAAGAAGGEEWIHVPLPPPA